MDIACCILPLGIEHVMEVRRLEEDSFTTPWSSQVLKETLLERSYLCYGIKEGGTLIAYSINRLVLDELQILRIGVASAQRQRSKALVLMSHVLDCAVQRGVRFATLECRVSNIGAERLYRHLGFSVQGTRCGYYADNGEDAFLFSCDLHHSDTYISKHITEPHQIHTLVEN